MHHRDTVHDSAVAPSPIVPTWRPDPLPSKSKRRQSIMPSSVSGSTVSTPPRGGMIPRAQVSPPRPQARSAGMAERPSRNENLSDLVRFFQTAQSTPTPGPSSVQAPTSPDSTTALPVVTESVEPKGKQLEMAKEVKPLHRRLLQFTQRQKKDLFPKSKLDDNQRQIEALQREGYLLPAPKPRSNHSAKTSISSKNSLERTFSKSKKQDVETIGQPWLDNDTKKGPSDFKRRLASLDLSDFGSMVDVAVSLSQQFDDSSPPPYQSLSSSGAASRGEQNSASQSSPTLPLSSSIYSRSNSDRPMSPPTSTAGTLGSVSQDDPGRQYSSASGSNMRTVDPDTKPTTQGLNIKPVGEDTPALSRPSVSSESKPDQSIGPAETATQTSDKSTSSSSGSPPSQPSLKLFPDVAPPRMSSKNAWRISSVPQYQRPPNPPSSAGTESPPGASELKPGKSTPSDISSRRSKDEGARRCSGVTTTSAVSTESATAEINNSQPSTQSKTKARPPSLAMGTLQAFPLPAPTRPLPSIPQPGRAPPAVPDAKTTTTVRTVRSTLKAPDVEPSHPSPIAEHPCEPGPDETQANEPPTDTRAATALGYAGEADSVADHDNAKSIHTPERPKSTSPEQSTPRRRASSIRIPRMQDLPESPDHEEQEGLPIADSPLLGQMTPTKVHDKRAPPPPLRTLRIDPRLDRNNLPFGLPSPPPTAALPSEPPTQPLPERPQGGRNYTAPIPASLHSSKGMDLHFAVGHHRASMISRSNSSRSSLRHESIPESSEPSRCESPLPSSDDEGFGPGADTTRSHRTSEKHPTRAHPLHQGYATMDARPSHGRLRYPHPIRTQTPQGRSSRTLEKSAMSPQSTYSQPTRRSRESHNTHRPQPNASQMTQYLEDRVANLERQNQILQAALMAALNAGVKNPFEGLGDSALPPGFSHLSHPSPYQSRFTPRPESWVSSSHSSENSGFETPGSYREGRPHVRQSDNRMEDIESGGWMSDKSSMSGARMARSR